RKPLDRRRRYDADRLPFDPPVKDVGGWGLNDESVRPAIGLSRDVLARLRFGRKRSVLRNPIVFGSHDHDVSHHLYPTVHDPASNVLVLLLSSLRVVMAAD